MSEKQFPNIAFKLSAPAKKTQYERKKAEDEAKRLRNEAEDAEAIAKLVAEFADSDDGDEPDPTTQQPTSSDMGGHKAHGHGFTPNVQPRRHRAPGAMKMSGPGTLGPLPGSDLSRKRGRDDGNDGENAEERYTYGGREYQNSNESASPSSGENSAEKPLQYSLTLKNLHPKMTVSEVKRLIPDPPLKIDKSQAITLRLDPFENRGESTPQIAVIKLEVGISADDVDRATSDMDGKIYLGEGYWLRIERTTSMTAVQKVVHPFNAQLHTDGPYAGELVVQVKLPTELPMVKLINRIAERVSQGMDGVKFEAFLMNQEEIQKDEDYAWLWDSDSSDGVYYRWRLWELKTYEYRTPAERKALRTGPQPIFDGGPIWLAPRLPKFQFVSELADFLDDSDYDSQEDSDEEDARKYNTGGLNDREEEPFKWLNALQRVKLTYMLRNLPVTTALLKKYHVAMVTSFGCRHAAIACEEIVEMVVSNVFRPVAFTRAEFESEKPTADQITSAKLVGLHIICDLCAAGATAPGSGYLYRRSVLEAMQRRNMFGHLGRQYLDLDLSPPKKKRFEAAVKAMLKVMEEHNLWDKASHDGLHENFDNPELTAAEQEAKDKEEAEKGRVKAQGKVELRAVVDEKDGVAEAGEGIKTTTTSLKAETTEADSKRIDKTSDTKARIQAAIAERTAGVQIQPTPVDTTKFASNFSKGYKAAIQKAAEEKAKVTRRKSEDVDMFADDDSE